MTEINEHLAEKGASFFIKLIQKIVESLVVGLLFFLQACDGRIGLLRQVFAAMFVEIPFARDDRTNQAEIEIPAFRSPFGLFGFVIWQRFLPANA